MKPDRTNGAAPIGHVLVCGGGLAGNIVVAALSHQLPPATKISFINVGDTSGTDLFYGSVTAPTAYAFNRAAGLSEPTLVMESDTAFSWGTKYDHWASGGRSWIQCFHLSLPIIDGVMFHHYLAQQGIDQLEKFLLPAVAGRKGAFVHPPQQAKQPAQQLLSRAEYGYQFDPVSYARLFEASIDTARVQRIDAQVSDVECSEAGISAIHLADGRSLTADLFVDCTGPEAVLLSRLGGDFSGNRQLRAAMSSEPATKLGAPLRTVCRGNYGWRAETPLKGRTTRLTIYHAESESEALSAHAGDPERSSEAMLGYRSQAWSGNCVAIGQAACTVEPLTPAPMMLLERDIERLLSLIPFSREMSIERREYNRHFNDDYGHARLFTRAVLEVDDLPDTPFWSGAREPAGDDKLVRKIELFKDRGMLVSYDFEPFNPEDWTILHYGMGRYPERYDRSADRAPPAQVQNYLANLKREIEKLADGLPSHAAYMAELTQYLTQSRR